MPSTYTSLLGLEKPADGEQNSTWGHTVNANMDRIEAAVGWHMISTTSLATAQNSVLLQLPSGYSQFRVEFEGIGGASPGPVVFQYSPNGGNTIIAGTAYTSFGYNVTQGVSGVSQVAQPNAYGVIVCPGNVTGANGSHAFTAYGGKPSRSSCTFTTAGGNIGIQDLAGLCSDQLIPTAINIFVQGTIMVSGTIRIFGRS